ncbi:hypothetical protein ACFL7M_09545 [Thermodesulfobacteriota bacterium]
MYEIKIFIVVLLMTTFTPLYGYSTTKTISADGKYIMGDRDSKTDKLYEQKKKTIDQMIAAESIIEANRKMNTAQNASDAINILDKVLSDNPKNAMAYTFRAQAKFRNGNHQAAFSDVS